MDHKDHVQKDATTMQNHLGSVFAGHEENVTSEVAKQFLLYGSYFWNGWMCKPQARNLGAGVYAISIKKD